MRFIAPEWLSRPIVAELYAGELRVEDPDGLAHTATLVKVGQEVPFDVREGAPSLTAAIILEDSIAPATRLRLVPPSGDAGDAIQATRCDGMALALTVMDPEPGTWTARVEAADIVTTPVRVAITVAAADDAKEHLLAAAMDVPDEGILPGLPRGIIPLILPVAVALRPHAGTELDIDAAEHAVPVVAASDLLGIEPDEVAEVMAALPRGAGTLDVAGALAAASHI